MEKPLERTNITRCLPGSWREDIIRAEVLVKKGREAGESGEGEFHESHQKESSGESVWKKKRV